MKHKLLGLLAAAMVTTSGIAQQPRLTIEADRPGITISPQLYGIFFEDINYGADGGLYAELVQNRSFEFHGKDALYAWNKVENGGAHMVYRHHNLEDLRRLGATNVHLVRSYFLPEKDHPVALTEEERRELGCDVIFAGHYEADGRLPYMERVAASDIDFRLFGTGWDPVTESGPLRRFHPVRRLNGDAYAKGICASKIALCFLSTLNRDTYTRRCFEIPAMGTMLLAQRTPDLETLFLPGVEADFFSSPDELMDKIRYYLAHSEIRESVATAGLRKVHEAGHDILSRMRQVESILTLARRQTV
ncbi:MAG: glycosyltransferase [Myxococcales bacterium]